ncbi:unnamed protein product [Heterobilharzia americana]|nr:unnamed protein product [Heterobilharzia americana]
MWHITSSCILIPMFCYCLCLWHIYFVSKPRRINWKTNSFTTRFILKFCVPPLIIFMLAFNVITADNLETIVGGHLYRFPNWSLTASWFVILAGVLPIPLNMILQYWFVRKRAKTCYWKTALLITPKDEHEEMIKEGYCKRLKIKHWLKI